MKKQLQIHSENILPIIKKWLYSDKDIFVRELISNACDALAKLERLAKENEAVIDPEDLKIEITIHKNTKQLIFSDGGLGMESEEIEKYIAQIAFSGAEDFIAKYQTQNEKDQMIGHFGLGFYSSYMVAHTVELHSRSYKNTPPSVWICDGSSQYTLEQGSRERVGTDVILHLLEDAEEFLEEAKIREIIQRYCAFMPYPIFLNGIRINKHDPLWLKNPTECTDQEYLDFYHQVFPQELDPLFWVHLQVDYPFHVKGVLYFPKLSLQRDFKKNNIKLFCNRVFVSEQCQDILPEYLTILHGALDSADIPLNVSRSALQMDQTVRQLGQHIAKKIADKLTTLYKEDREKFISYWGDLELFIKFGMFHDDKFYERTKHLLLWQNTQGEWTTIEEHREHTKNTNKIYFTPSVSYHGVEWYKEKAISLLVIESSMLNQALISFLEKKLNLKFQRIDAEIPEELLDPEKEKNLLDADGKSERVKLAELFKQHIALDHVDIEAKSFDSATIPGVILIKEEERRMHEYLEAHHRTVPMAPKSVFVINTNNKLINLVSKLQPTKPDLAQRLVKDLYDLARFAQRQLDDMSSATFFKRHLETLEQLVYDIGQQG